MQRPVRIGSFYTDMHAQHADAVHLPTPAPNTLEAVQVVTESSATVVYAEAIED